MYKKLLIATTNKNKITRIKKLLADVQIEVLSLEDLEVQPPAPAETASTCIEIAAEKVLGYVNHVDDNTIVLTQDDTVSFEGVDTEDNPGPAIKEPVVKRFGVFNDQNALLYYTELAKKYGGEVPMKFSYGHAIAYRGSGPRKIIHLHSSESYLHSKLVEKQHKPETVPGYFLAAIMQIRVNGVWRNYTDLNDAELIDADSDLKDSILGLLRYVE